MLRPLAVGTHTIHFYGKVPKFRSEVDVTYILTVVSPQAATARVASSGPMSEDASIYLPLIQR